MASSYLAPARGQGRLHQQGYARNRDEVRSIALARAIKVQTAGQHRATHTKDLLSLLKAIIVV